MTNTPHPPVKTEPKAGRGNGKNGMMALTQEVEQHHLAPAPGTTDPLPRPFPPPVTRGLGAGILAGALVGLLMGVLLFNGVLVVPGWEKLFSMGPFTFHVFWVVIGIAVGVLTIGIGAILWASPEPDDTQGP